MVGARVCQPEGAPSIFFLPKERLNVANFIRGVTGGVGALRGIGRHREAWNRESTVSDPDFRVFKAISVIFVTSLRNHLVNHVVCGEWTFMR